MMEQLCMDQEPSNNQTENMLYFMLQKCKTEAESEQLTIPIIDYVERVSYYTGISKHKLYEIHVLKLSENTSDLKPAEFHTVIQILKYLINIYLEKKLPTFKLLYDKLKADKVLDYDFEEFKQNVALLGIEYKTLYDKTFLIEDADYSCKRYFYLDKMKKLRAKYANIYYVDERLIDKDFNFRKPWKETINSSNSHSYVLFHAISRSGYKNGLFCNNASKEEFQKWLVDILLGQLEPASVIVFDNSPLHGTFETTPLTMYDSKQNMIKCLQMHNVPYSHNMNKVQLYDLIKKFVIAKEMHYIDRVIKANGHEVLRLPTNLLNLSPVKLMWEELKKTVATPLLNSLLFDSRDEIHAQLISMPKEKFSEFEQNIEEKENEMLLLHSDLENVQEKFLSDLEDSKRTPKDFEMVLTVDMPRQPLPLEANNPLI